MSSDAAARFSKELLRRTLFSFVKLNESGDFTRRSVHMDDLPEESRELVQRFVEARLFVVDSNGGRTTVEVAHEMIFRDWSLLADWLRQFRSFFEWQRGFAQAILDWEMYETTLSSAALKELLRWQLAGLIIPDLKTQQLIDSSQRHVRFTNTAAGVSSSLRLGLSFAGGWYLASLFSSLVQRLQPSGWEVSFGLPTCYSCLFEFALGAAAIGAAFGVLGLGMRLANAATGAAIFLTLAIASGISTVGVFGNVGLVCQIVRNLPAGVAFFGCCLMLVLIVRKQITKRWIALAAALAACLVYLNLQSVADNLALTPLQALWKGAVLFARMPMSTLTDPDPSGIRIMSFAAGAMIGWQSHFQRPRRSEPPPTSVTSRRLPAVCALLAALTVGLAVLGYCAQRQVDIASDLEYLDVMAERLIAAQESVRRVTGSFGKSYGEIKAGERLLLDSWKQACLAKNGGIFSPSVPDDLRAIDALHEAERLFVMPPTIQILRVDQQSWSGHMSLARDSSKGCLVSQSGRHCDVALNPYHPQIGWNRDVHSMLFCDSLKEHPAWADARSGKEKSAQ